MLALTGCAPVSGAAAVVNGDRAGVRDRQNPQALAKEPVHGVSKSGYYYVTNEAVGLIAQKTAADQGIVVLLRCVLRRLDAFVAVPAVNPDLMLLADRWRRCLLSVTSWRRAWPTFRQVVLADNPVGALVAGACAPPEPDSNSPATRCRSGG